MANGRLFRRGLAFVIESVAPNLAQRLRSAPVPAAAPSGPAPVQSTTTDVPVAPRNPPPIVQRPERGPLLRLLLGERSDVPVGVVTFFTMVARKLTVFIVGAAITWCHVHLGWDLVSFFGDSFETLLIEAITGYFLYRIGNVRPARAN